MSANNGTVLAFPCGPDLVPGFLARVEARGATALLLAKQEATLGPRLREHGISDVCVLPEAMYGRISSDATRQRLADLHARGAGEAFFPVSDFCGNSVPLLRLVAAEVTAVNATSLPPVRETAVAATPPIAATAPAGLAALQAEIIARLADAEAVLRAMARGGRSGEKPTTGLLDGFPYDFETLFRYAATPAEAVQGRVLEVGCGLGFGAWLLARLHPGSEFVVTDIDAAAIAAARELWQGPPNLRFEAGPAGGTGHAAGSFDAILAYELVEHLAAPSTFLGQCRSLLRPGGHLVGSTPVSSLFAYRVNTTGRADPALRAEGIWPWHLQEFDEASLGALLEACGFTGVQTAWPTWETGLAAFGRLGRRGFAADADDVAPLAWGAADFGLRAQRVPCFSGSSFIFRARKP